MILKKRLTLGVAILLLTLLAGCAGGPVLVENAVPDGASATPLVIYSGRNENLVGPLIDQYRQATGQDVQVRYGDTAEMASTILEEGANSPADVFYGQDAGALGALAGAGRLETLPDDILNRVDARFRSDTGQWVGSSGRARVLVYNTNEVDPDGLPADIWGLTEEQWRGKIGWAPTNGSFQAFVTALRRIEGEDRAREWLTAMIANDVKVYPNNDSIVAAVGSGEILAGLVNHYYLLQFKAEKGQDFPAQNYFFPSGGPGNLINVAGAGVINTSENKAAAEQFVAFLLSDAAQSYFASTTDEYPLAGTDIPLNPAVRPLSEINAPGLDLSNLDDLQGTLMLLQEVGALN
ncbi:MAG: iron ABC transporter substrate-binding protein [Caldilineales bacterium]